MVIEAIVLRVQTLVLFCATAMTLVITPWANLDSVNIIKFVVLCTSTLAALGILAPYSKQLFDSKSKSQTFSIALFLIALVVALVASDVKIQSQVYGTFGRNTGLLTYFCLATMLFLTSRFSNIAFVQRLLGTLIAVGFVNALYGLIQILGIDPINWDGTYKPIIGTLGNSNFLSALLGISGAALLSFALDQNRDAIVRFSLFASISLLMGVIYQSKSSQGLFLIILATPLIFYFRFIATHRSFIRRGYWLVISIVLLVGVFGILNKGPLASLLYQESVTYRGDYWRAGWKMTLYNPFFGVGLDSYGDWYRFSRTEAATLRRGPELTSNSAHNVFLDLSSSGGFLPMIVYILILGLILRSAWRVFHFSNDYDAIGVGLVSAWFAYLVQSFISINQLGLAIWGWVLGGAIIGYEKQKRDLDYVWSKFKSTRQVVTMPAAAVLSGTLGLALGFIVSIWPMAQDIAFKRALESRNVSKIVLATQVFPRNNYYYVLASRILLENGFKEKSLSLAQIAIATNPRDFNAWEMLVANPNLSETEKASAIARMKELDPFNNTLDKQ